MFSDGFRGWVKLNQKPELYPLESTKINIEKVRHRSMHLDLENWENRDNQIIRVQWPASLAWFESSRQKRYSVSNTKLMVHKEQWPRLPSALHTHIYTHVYVYLHINIYIYHYTWMYITVYIVAHHDIQPYIRQMSISSPWLSKLWCTDPMLYKVRR